MTNRETGMAGEVWKCEMWCSSEAGKFQCIRYGHHH